MQFNRTKAYFWKNMSPYRRQKFESELEDLPELKTEYQIYMAIHSDIRTMTQISDAISDPNIQEAFKPTNEAIKEYQREKDGANYVNPSNPAPQEVSEPIEIYNDSQNKVRKSYFYISGLAALLLLALLFKFLVFETDPTKLIEKYYSQAEMALNNNKGGDENQSASLNLAYNLYSKGEVEKAGMELNSSFQNYVSNPLALYLKGLIEIENNNFPLAIESLSKSLTANDAFYLEKQWYLGLCYLKLGNLEEANSSLSILSQFTNTYQSDATTILRKIRRRIK